jgi:hypothetical protein
MVIGTLILAIAFVDRFYQVVFFNYDELEKKWEIKDDKQISEETQNQNISINGEKK